MAEALDHPYSLCLACFQLGTLHSLRGEADLAVHLLERCLALFRESNIAIFSPNVTAWLGHAYARSGRVAEGLSLLQ